ncbi:MAG: hypothetical protein HYU54_03425, partial [Actinobacteria bacterium]|nr:hypothetical protein [Actinomycetota bacterium]
MRLRLPLLALIALALVVPAVRGLAPAASPHALGAESGADLDVYRGLGSWVDIYDDAAWAHPRRAVRSMRAHGVRTLYLETSNYKRHQPFVFRDGVERFVDAAHDSGLRVVAWYLPGFDDLDRDFRRTMAAVRFVTARGNGFDSFALDIESPEVSSPSLRTSRLLELSSRIRAAVGDAYPLGAIIPSPLGMEANPDYWPRFPYAELSSAYDVFLPMTYFTWRISGLEGAHDYSAGNIDIVRERTGNPSVPIHVIGGISDDATDPETRGFVRAVRERGVIGASYYGFVETSYGDWAELSAVPPNPTEVPALPVELPSADALGNIPGLDQTHPKEVFFRTGGRPRHWNLTFEAYDAQAGEVAIWVNWRLLGTVPPTDPAAWG